MPDDQLKRATYALRNIVDTFKSGVDIGRSPHSDLQRGHARAVEKVPRSSLRRTTRDHRGGPVIALAACGSNASSSGGSSPEASGTTPLRAGVLHAFTGQNAFFGPNAQNACKAAAAQIKRPAESWATRSTARLRHQGRPGGRRARTTRMLVSASTSSWSSALTAPTSPRSYPPRAGEGSGDEHRRRPALRHADLAVLLAAHPERQHAGARAGVLHHQQGFTKIVEVFTSDLSA